MMRSSIHSYPTIINPYNNNLETMNCLSCLRDITKRKRTTCNNCYANSYCNRCMINGWCKPCYTSRKMICPLCKHQVDTKNGHRNICIKCNIGYCNDCGIDSFCRDCYIDNEKDELIQVIARHRSDICVSSIAIIASYCIGYVITCCNERKGDDGCTNDIIFHNKYEYLICSEYKYLPKINLRNSIKIYGQNVRIFCTECTTKKMEPCLNVFGGKCMNMEICGENKYGNICGNHPVCYHCGQQELKQEPFFSQIHALHEGLRRFVYYTAKSSTIRQCAICKFDFCKDCIFYNGLFCKKCGDEYNEIINMNTRKLGISSTANSHCTTTADKCHHDHKATTHNRLNGIHGMNECSDNPVNQQKTTKNYNPTPQNQVHTNPNHGGYTMDNREINYEQLENNNSHSMYQGQLNLSLNLSMMDTKIKNEPLSFEMSNLNVSSNFHGHGMIGYPQTSMYDCYTNNLSLIQPQTCTIPQPPIQQQPPPLFKGIGSCSIRSVSSIGSPQSIAYDLSWGSNSNSTGTKSMTPISTLGSPSYKEHNFRWTANKQTQSQQQDLNIVSLGNTSGTVIDI